LHHQSVENFDESNPNRFNRLPLREHTPYAQQMERIVLYILIFLTFMTLLVAALSRERSNRVMKFLPSMLRLIPISAIVRALLGGNKNDDESK
jgi:peptidoglycan biosynthesis protein MviN/MurJ (putative lipid II flippase)